MKKFLIFILITFTLVSNVSAGTDGEINLSKKDITVKNILLFISFFSVFASILGQVDNKKYAKLIAKKEYSTAIEKIYKANGEALYQSNPKAIYNDIIQLLNWEGKVFQKQEIYKKAKNSYEEGLDYLTKKTKLYSDKLSAHDINLLDNYAKSHQVSHSKSKT